MAPSYNPHLICPGSKRQGTPSTYAVFEPNCAFRTVGSYALLSVCLSVCLYGLDQKSDWIIIHTVNTGWNKVRPTDIWQYVKQIIRQGTVAMTGRAHCQCQVAFFVFRSNMTSPAISWLERSITLITVICLLKAHPLIEVLGEPLLPMATKMDSISLRWGVPQTQAKSAPPLVSSESQHSLYDVLFSLANAPCAFIRYITVRIL